MALKQFSTRITIETRERGFVEITADVTRALDSARITEGLATLFCRHTSSSLTIQENADPDLLRDLGDALDRLAPEGADYRHTTEGPDDMPAHIRAMLTGVSLSIPVLDGKLALGVWQGIYLVEHRARPHQRELVLQVIGE